MGGRYLGNLRNGEGALGSSWEHEGTVGSIPPLNRSPLRTLFKKP